METLEPIAIFHRIVILLGLDPSQVDFTAIAHRLEAAALASISIANTFALLGAIFYVATLLMRTIVPLRISAMISDVFFVAYAVLANSVTTFYPLYFAAAYQRYSPLSNA